MSTQSVAENGSWTLKTGRMADAARDSLALSEESRMEQDKRDTGVVEDQVTTRLQAAAADWGGGGLLANR